MTAAPADVRSPVWEIRVVFTYLTMPATQARYAGRPSPPHRDKRQGSAADQLAGEEAFELVDGHPLLGHAVALAHGDGLIMQRVEVDGHAERRADLVLAAVAPADGARVVEVDVPVVAQHGGDVPRLRGEVRVARQREHGDLHGREPAIEAPPRPPVPAALRVRRLVLAVGVEQ